MRPILEKLRAAGLLMADKLQAALITQLEVAAAEPLPDVPDYSMLHLRRTAETSVKMELTAPAGCAKSDELQQKIVDVECQTSS